MNPWDWFDLDSETATKAELKRAYARLLKKHRPDRDAETFQQVREAYEICRQWLESGDNGERFHELVVVEDGRSGENGPAAGFESSDDSDGEVAVDKYSATAFRGKDCPAELQAIIDCLEGAESKDNLYDAYQAGAEYCRDFPSQYLTWGKAVVDRFNGEFTQDFVEWFQPKDSLLELKADCAQQTLFWIDSLDEADDLQRLGELAVVYLAQREPSDTFSAAHAYIKLAEVVGFTDGNYCDRLMNLAYPALPISERDYMLSRAEQQSNYGRIFRNTVSTPRIMFWRQRLRENESGVEYDWSCEEGQKEIKLLVKPATTSRQILEVIQYVVPDDVHAQAVKAYEEWEQSQHFDEEMSSQEEEEGGCSLTAIFWIVIAVLYVVIRFGGCSGGSSSSFQRSEAVIPPVQLEKLEGYYNKQSFLQFYLSDGVELGSDQAFDELQERIGEVSELNAKAMVSHVIEEKSESEAIIWLTEVVARSDLKSGAARGISERVDRWAVSLNKKSPEWAESARGLARAFEAISKHKSPQSLSQ